MPKRALVTGAGGFIGHHLVRRLVDDGWWVRGVDIKSMEFGPTPAHEFKHLDLRRREFSEEAVEGIDEVYHLAADMGGIGYISGDCARIATNNVLIDTHLIEAAADAAVSRLFYASSACVYPQHLQLHSSVEALGEDDAWPADPEEGYGLEKLFGEELCRYYERDGRLQTRVARFHNVYGPLGAYEGGREKAPAAICRKVAMAEDGDELEIWGDGQQTRTFMYVDDCVEGVLRIMRSDFASPLNLGTHELVSVCELANIVERIAGKRLERRFDTTKPQGVRGRNSDNMRLRSVVGWEPSVPLEQGLGETYAWIAEQLGRPVRSLVEPRVGGSRP